VLEHENTLLGITQIFIYGSFGFAINGWMRIALEGIWKESTAAYFQATIMVLSGGN